MCVKHNTHPTARLLTGSVERIASKLLWIMPSLLLLLFDYMGTRKINLWYRPSEMQEDVMTLDGKVAPLCNMMADWSGSTAQLNS